MMSGSDGRSPTRYRVSIADAVAHLFEVRCTIDDPGGDGQRFRLPTWVPGSYLVREFARHFVTVRAETPSGAVHIEKVAKDTWRAAPCAGPLTVVAIVYAYDVSVRTAYLDATRAYFNGAALFVCPEGREAHPCTLEVELPSATTASHWKIATTLARDGDGARFRAADYDELIDHPVEMSDFVEGAFRAGGVAHRVAISGRVDVDMPRLERDLARVCQAHVDLFGAPPPFPEYLFQVMAVGDGYGGLEHRASTSLLASRRDLPAPGANAGAPADDYVGFLGLASHEYFHAWNVKRIKPAAFVPYDLSREAYTRQLWAFEGITSYYDDLALVRSGVIDTAKYLELVGRNLTNVLRTPGRRVQSVADASFDAWIKHYRPDENTPNAAISYYAKGAVVALALDLTLRNAGRASLDDVMRALWQRYGKGGTGVPEDALPRLVAEAGGRDPGDFFARYVDGTEDPPLAELLEGVGLRLTLRAARDDRDRGGTAPKDDDPRRAWLGAKVAADGRVVHAWSGGPAQRAGLAGNDTLVAIDGLRATPDAIATLLARKPAGARVAVHAFRRDELHAFDVMLAEPPRDTAFLAIDEAATPEAQARRAAWLAPRGGAAS